MKFVVYRKNGVVSLGVLKGETLLGPAASEEKTSPDLQSLLVSGPKSLQAQHQRLLSGEPVDTSAIEYLPPFPDPQKIICVGLNYKDHAAESGFTAPTYPALFSRFSSSLVGHGAPIVRPRVSEELDYEGELVVVIGKPGRDIPVERALEHVAGYSIFNDASVRDYQFKSAQWMIGKNFDATGGFGPAFVTADELPAGAKGLRLRTRLNGEVLQEANTEDMIFDVATQISLLSEAMMLCPGDVLVTGTPSGVGFAREPKIFMKPGDRCEIEIEGIGVLSNPVVEQPKGRAGSLPDDRL